MGIVRLDDSLVELVHSGAISLEDALAVAESPGDFAAKAGQPAGAR
jgi:Tfp pilus assembly ATPase PilU